jgi:hypothetical protein
MTGPLTRFYRQYALEQGGTVPLVDNDWQRVYVAFATL